MAEPTQFYNPIIQAMVATANLQKQTVQQEIEKTRNADEKKLREQALKQEETHAKNQHDIQLKAHDLAAKSFELQKQQSTLQAEVQHLKALGEAREFVRNGGKQEALGNAFPWLKKIMEDGAGSQMPLYNPQQEAQNVRSLAAAQSGGAAEGVLPSQISLADHNRKAQADTEKDLLKYKSELEITDKKLDRASHEKIAQIMANSRVKDPSGDPEVNKSLLMLGATGEINLTPTNPLHMKVLSALEESGARAFDKKEAVALKESKKLLPIFDQMEKFSENLASSRPGAFVEGAIVKAKGAVGYSSKIQNDWSILRSRAIVIGRALEGMTGRPLAVQLKTDLDSLPGPGITKQDAKDRIKNLRELLVGVEDSLFTGMPDWQKDLVSKKYGFTSSESPEPEWLKLAPKTSKAGRILNREESLKAGHAVYEDK